MSAPGAMGLIDVTPRMALFGQLFLQHASNPSPASALADARAAVDAVRATVPRSTAPGDQAPVFEAAAYLGEWLRARGGVPSSWVAEGPAEPLLQATDATGSIAYVLPLVSVVRVASSAGYDGLAPLLESVLADLSEPARRCHVSDIRVFPEDDQIGVAAWLHAHLARRVTAAVLERRCRACSAPQGTQIDLQEVATFGWMGAASLAAAHLGASEFACACGGAPGEASRFLLVHDEGPDVGYRFLDVLMTGTHTRISSWRIRDDWAEPAAQ